MKRRFAFSTTLVTTLALATELRAQPQPATPPPPPPPPGYAPAPYPPPPYPPAPYSPAPYPPGYGLPPPPGYYYAPNSATPIATGGKVPSKMDPNNPPAGYHTESRARSGLVVAGGVMFGISYLISVAAAAGGLSDRSHDLVPLFVPVAGPFVTLGSAHVFDHTSDEGKQVGRVFGAMGLIIDGLVQVSGFSLAVIGLAVRKDVVVRDSAGDSEARARPLVPDVAVGPGGATARWSF